MAVAAASEQPHKPAATDITGLLPKHGCCQAAVLIAWQLQVAKDP
jgi:hypothetical protein